MAMPRSLQPELLVLSAAIDASAPVRFLPSGSDSLAIARCGSIEAWSSCGTDVELERTWSLRVFDPREHVEAMIPIRCSDGSEALFVLTSSLKWVVCSRTHEVDGLRVDDKGDLLLSAASRGGSNGHLFPARAPGIVVSRASTREGHSPATTVAVWAWDDIVSLVEIIIHGEDRECSTSTAHFPIPADWGGGLSDATALAVVEQRASEAAARSSSNGARLPDRLSATNSESVDAGFTSPQNECSVVQLAIVNSPPPHTEGLALVILHTEGSLAVDSADGDVVFSSPGPCHLRCLHCNETTGNLEGKFSVENVHPSTLVSIFGFSGNGPIVLCVSDLDIILLDESGFLFRRARSQPTAGSLTSLQLLSPTNPAQYLLVSDRGSFELLSFESEHRIDATSSEIVCTTESNDGASEASTISWVSVLGTSPTKCIFVVGDENGQVSLAKLNMYTPRHITMDFLTGNPFRSRFLAPLVDMVPLSAVPTLASLGTPFLLREQRSTENDSERVPAVSSKHCPSKVIVCGGAGKNSLGVMEKGWPLLTTELSACDVGLGPGCRMFAFNQSSEHNSKSLLFFDHEGLQSLMELTRTVKCIAATAMDIQVTGLGIECERTIGLHPINLPEMSDKMRPSPSVVLHTTHTRVRVLSDDCSRVLSEWAPPSTGTTKQVLVAVGVPTVSACHHSDASMFLFALALSKGGGGCEICILGIGVTNKPRTSSLSIYQVASFSTLRAVSHLTMYDSTTSGVILDRRRRAVVAVSCWDATETPSVMFIATDDAPFLLRPNQAQSGVVAMALLFDSCIPLPNAPVPKHSTSGDEPPLISSMLFITLVTIIDGADDDSHHPSLVAGLTDGRVIVVDWSIAPSNGASPSAVVLQEIAQFRVGRQPVEKLIPLNLGRDGEFNAKTRQLPFALIAHSSDADMVLNFSCPRVSVPLRTRPLLGECLQGNPIVAVFGDNSSKGTEIRRSLCAVGSNHRYDNDGAAAELDVDLVWQDDLGRISLGMLSIATHPPVSDAASEEVPSALGSVLQPEYICQRHRTLSTGSVSHLLYLPHLDALLVASCDKATGRSLLAILDTSTGEVAFKELWRQNLATSSLTTALSLACAPPWDAMGALCDQDGARTQVVAVASITERAKESGTSAANHSHVALLEFHRPRGLSNAVSMDCLGAVGIGGACFGLGLVQPRAANGAAAVVATVDTELLVLAWTRRHHPTESEVNKVSGWRLHVEDKAMAPDGGVFTALSTLGSCAAAAELLASVLVYRWSGATSGAERTPGQLILVARHLGPTLASSILLVPVAPRAASSECPVGNVEEGCKLLSLGVALVDARRAGVTCLRVARLSRNALPQGAGLLPPVSVPPKLSGSYRRQSRKDCLNAASSDDEVAEMTEEATVEAFSSEAISLLRSVDPGGGKLSSVFIGGCRGSIALCKL